MISPSDRALLAELLRLADDLTSCLDMATGGYKLTQDETALLVNAAPILSRLLAQEGEGQAVAWLGESPGGSLLISRHETDSHEWADRGWTITPLFIYPDTEINKLIEYFNDEGYQEYGWHGDEKGFTPAETAIHFLKERAQLYKAAAPDAEGEP